MKQGKTLIELAAELERQKETKRDFISPATQLQVKTQAADEKGAGFSILGLGETEAFEVGETAHEQIASRLDIPKRYYERMRKESGFLLDQNINHWLKSEKDSYMVRTLDGKARALLSSKFRPLDNADLAEVALPVLLQSGAQIESCEVTERKLYLKAVTPKINFEVGVGDVVQAGIVISNSEIGLGAISIEPLIYRKVCKNGLIINDAKMRKTHVGRGNEQFEHMMEWFRDETRQADDKAFWMKVRDVLSSAFSTIGFGEMVEKFRASKGDIITADPVKVVELTQKKFSLADSEKNGVLKYLLGGGDLNRFGLVNAVTQMAQDVPSYDRSTELEKLGGTILELPKTDWSVIADA